MVNLGVVMVALVVVLVTLIWELLKVAVWRPYVVTKMFEKQGVRGPAYKFLYGSITEMKTLEQKVSRLVLDINSNDIIPKVLPHYHKWSSEYGNTLLYWHETQPRVVIADAELAKQILSNKFGFYVKPETRPSIIKLIGKGLIFVEGMDWARHRRILNPAFSMDKLKVMVKRISECTIKMLDEWKAQAMVAEDLCVKIKINENFNKLTADIISHIAFGSSYVQGMEAFKAQKELQRCCAASATNIFIPGSQYLPTPSNIQIWKLDRKLKRTLEQIVSNRLKSLATKNSEVDYVDDLLGLMIGASRNSEELNMYEIMEECKTFFFAGHETTSNLLTWTLFLLSKHQDWQDRLREEVFIECGTAIPDADMLTKLKLVNMVLLESLRLYGPATELGRQATRDMKLGNLLIPKNTCLMINIAAIHRNRSYWGDDAHEFNPLRFKDGVSKAATHPNAFIAFSIGPRVCIGQNFAMLEAKTVLTLLLQRFRFTLASEYKHAPVNILSLQPQFGLPVLARPLQV
ncbi:hypothetical protein K2173_004838 [Erythroxylum novogranatense]|uniref:Cytochrome P450 n=1 Tax=Erythroxylum novogranatense TaxID=1862640 RepID=A0AAV8UB75_9ROSI|nr:hypothetical protein K2173_004838 [Erythroxylum novogranatense]